MLDKASYKEYNIDKLRDRRSKGERTMTREEMMRIVYTLEAHTCEGCPLAEQCEAHELFWGCGVWEEGMGEDL